MRTEDIKGFLNNIYRKNSKTKSYLVDIKIDHYHDLFNDLDPSPLKRRDLDKDFISYLEDASRDIPLNYAMDLHLHCDFADRQKEKENRISLGINTYYRFLLMQKKREITVARRQSLVYFLIGLLFLFSSFYISRKVGSSYLDKILIEGTNIGGWVFVWECLALTVFKSGIHRREAKRIQRIIHSGLFFHYSKP